jgi:hypothetical protein
MRLALTILSVGLTAVVPACEPEDTPGGRLIEIRLRLSGKNPGPEGRYVMLVGEHSPLKATGVYDSGREENITLSLFWQMEPVGHAIIDCQQDELTGNRVIIEGVSPGVVEISAFTREVNGSQIPCSPTPDGGWSFPDAGSEWPLHSDPIAVEVR